MTHPSNNAAVLDINRIKHPMQQIRKLNAELITYSATFSSLNEGSNELITS